MLLHRMGTISHIIASTPFFFTQRKFFFNKNSSSTKFNEQKTQNKNGHFI